MKKKQKTKETVARLSDPFPDEDFTDVEAAKLLLDAWKFRQAHCWKSLQTFWFAAVTVSIVPYVLTKSQVERFDWGLIVFPILGMLIAVAAVWLYAAEYVRCQPLSWRFRELLVLHDYFEPMRLSPMLHKLLLDWKIGWTTIVLLLATSILLPLINLMFVICLIL